MLMTLDPIIDYCQHHRFPSEHDHSGDVATNRALTPVRGDPSSQPSEVLVSAYTTL
jgi:hypothetical protein